MLEQGKEAGDASPVDVRGGGRGVAVFVGEHGDKDVTVSQGRMQLWIGWCQISIEPRPCADLESRRGKDLVKPW